MNKQRLYMLGLFCSGLLLLGIGAGMTFAEFAGLRYGGERLPESAQSKTQNFSVDIGARTGPVYFEEYYFADCSAKDVLTMQTSATVSSGELSVHVAYDTCGPDVNVWLNEADDPQASCVYFGTRSWNDFAVMMRMKDAVLKDLKAGQLSSYIPIQVTEITVTVNPADAARIQLPSEQVREISA